MTLRTIFHLALHQTEGFVASLVRLMGLDLRTPGHTTLSRRGSTLEAPGLARKHEEPIHLVIDSTGLKVVGGGEWHAFKHRVSSRRRSWRELHIGVDEDGFIVASALIESGRDDASVGAELLEHFSVPVASFRGDGAYATRALYDALAAAGTPHVDVVIPPRRTASSSSPTAGLWQQRAATIEGISEVGRRQRRKEPGAQQQARAKNGMFRFKQVLGDRPRSRRMGRQKREAMVGVHVLNGMATLGMPESEASRP